MAKCKGVLILHLCSVLFYRPKVHCYRSPKANKQTSHTHFLTSILAQRGAKGSPACFPPGAFCSETRICMQGSPACPALDANPTLFCTGGGALPPSTPPPGINDSPAAQPPKTQPQPLKQLPLGAGSRVPAPTELGARAGIGGENRGGERMKRSANRRKATSRFVMVCWAA